MKDDLKRKKEGLFRKEALDQSKMGRSLDHVMVVVSPKVWVALWSILSLVALTLIWSFVGIIPVDVSGQGILLNEGANFVVQAVEEGHMQTVYVNQGDTIQEGQLLAEMHNMTKELELENALKQKDIIMSQLMDYRIFEHKKNEAEKKAILDGIESNSSEIARVQADLDFLYNELKWKKELHEKGIIALPSVNETQERINAKISSQNLAKNNILKGKAKLKELENVLQIQEYHSRLERVESQIKDLKLAKKRMKIYAPFSGKVIAIPVETKELITQGKVVFWCEKQMEPDAKQVMYAYFTGHKDQRIREGMVAQVKLNTVDYKRFGDLLMRVKKVWDFPASAEEIYKLLGNEQIVKFLTKEGSLVQVLLEPLPNKKTVSGYAWTSKSGPHFKLHSGSMGRVQVVIRGKKPYEFVFPVYRTIRDTVIFTRIQDRRINRCTRD